VSGEGCEKKIRKNKKGGGRQREREREQVGGGIWGNELREGGRPHEIYCQRTSTEREKQREKTREKVQDRDRERCMHIRQSSAYLHGISESTFMQGQ